MAQYNYALPAIAALIGVPPIVKVVRRSLRLDLAWRSGLSAEARCLEAFETEKKDNEGGRTRVRHRIYEFTTRQGRTVRFEERDGPVLAVPGDIVVVHYSPRRPERATARPPAPVKNWVKAAGAVGAILLGIGLFAYLGTVPSDE
ncbi:DUF3592 domain-containing protein [Streptomyces sp. NPDC020681]|uniref:DUF3592 domain-containing protein n=1 Tax=Streptomyces sp. NPDC020681 TaxID=3365083 RepID=UPI0037B30C1F